MSHHFSSSGRKKHTTHPKLIGLHTLADRMNLILDHVCALPDLSLMTIYFQFQGGFYRPKHGCPICSPVSSIVANINIEEVESRASTSCTETASSHWYRYVDNTWVKTSKTLEVFRGTQQHSRRKHRLGGRQRSKSGLLGRCRAGDGSLNISIYRKPSHSDRYLLFNFPTTHWSTN